MQKMNSPLLVKWILGASLLATGFDSFALTSGIFLYDINVDTNTVTITGLVKGSGGAVNIPPVLENKTVTAIGPSAFKRNDAITSVIIPSSVISIEGRAFEQCENLTSASLPNSISIINNYTFSECRNLAEITIPDSVSTIDGAAFYRCESLMSVVLPTNITTVGHHTFEDCRNLATLTILDSGTTLETGSFNSCPELTGVYCHDDAPTFESDAFMGSTTQAIIYYREGTAGWNPTHSGRPTVLWNPYIQVDDGEFGDTGTGFGFYVSESASGLVVVESRTNLTDGVWVAVQTNVMSNSSFLFTDPSWTNHPERFYRLAMP